MCIHGILKRNERVDTSKLYHKTVMQYVKRKDIFNLFKVHAFQSFLEHLRVFF